MPPSAIGFQSIPAKTFSPGHPQGPGPGSESEARSDPLKPRELTPEQERVVRELQQRDREVRAHEQAHKAAAGSHARGGPSYTYQTGPDGRRYAIGGEVKIDTSPEATPEATLRKMRQLQRAANAPAEPSPQDRQVALEAKAAEAEARADIAARRGEHAGSSVGGQVDTHA